MDIRTLDLNLLKIFEALADEQNVTAAAQRLHVSQPAASGMLARLRDYFDDPLFVRAQHGVVPTPRALELIPGIKEIIASTQGLLHESPFDPASLELTFTIAGTDYAHKAVSLPFIRHLLSQAPRVRVAMVPIDSQRVVHQAAKGELDIALGTVEMAPLEMHSRRLYDEHYVCAMRKGHPLLQQSQLTLEQFCQYDQALASYSGAVFSGNTDEALAAQGLSRQVKVATHDFLLLPELTRSSDLIAVVPQRLVHDLDYLEVRDPPLAIAGFTKMALWHERTHYSRAHQWIRQQLVDVCRSFDSVQA